MVRRTPCEAGIDRTPDPFGDRRGPDLRWFRQRYANSLPGTSEAFLSTVRTADGTDPYTWIADAVPGQAGFVVDVAAGSAVLAERLPDARYVGIDLDADELALALQRRPDRWYVRADARSVDRVLAKPADTVVSGMALQLLRPMEQAVAALAGCVRRGGTLVATVPDGLLPAAAIDGTDRALREAVMVALGFGGALHANATRLDELPVLAARHGLRTVSDDRRRFRLPVVSAVDAWFVAATHADAGSPHAVVEAAADVLLDAAPCEWALSIRRLVAVRDGRS